MKTFIRLVVYFIFLSLYVSCSFIKKSLFETKVGEYQRPQFLLNGYYVSIEKNLYNKSLNEISILFFYTNGIFAEYGINLKDIDKLKESTHLIGDIKKYYNVDVNQSWGGYTLSDKHIIINKMKHRNQGHFLIIEFVGSIINDHSLQITKKRVKDNSEEINDQNIVYQFIPSNKPDSLLSNPWENKKWYWQNK